MRVVGGRLKGRNLASPSSQEIRPTADRLRESVFNILVHAYDDPIEGAHKNGRTYLRPCLESHSPLDLVIVMLGTNDLKIRFGAPASEVAMGVSVLVHDIRELATRRNGAQSEIMIVSPPPMLDDMKEWGSVFAGASEKSHRLALEFERLADSLECHFFDAGAVARSHEDDGVHLGSDAHRALGQALAQEVEAIGWMDV